MGGNMIELLDQTNVIGFLRGRKGRKLAAGSPSMGICRGHVSVGRRPSPSSADGRR